MTNRIKQNTEELSSEWMQARQGERFLIRIPASATDGLYSITEIVASPGDSTPVHVHQKEDEHLLVIEGTARILYRGKTVDATAGTLVSLARDVPHAWGNPTQTPIRLMVIATPGGCEEALRMIATGGDQPNLHAIAEKFAITVVGPPLLEK
jgi:mannose-6-phosphate isomerase-like protein (cupin superfamily)